MNEQTVMPMDPGLIPVIDIAPLRDGSAPNNVARALHTASQQLGFIYIKCHGIDEAVIEAARKSALAFFHSRPSQKQTVRISPRHRGWLDQGNAKMHDDARPDLKESFIWGDEDEHGFTAEDHPLRGVNQWPIFIPALQEQSMAYFRQAHRLAQYLMKGFALGLDLDEGFFLRHCQRPLSRASYVYYPPQAATNETKQFGVAPHTDFGVLTILCQDDVGGLQIEDAAGRWIAAPPIAGSLVVNVADLLSRWTDGAYKSTPHRVINTAGRERLSLVLAFDPDPETLIDAREVFGANHIATHPPISCGEYLEWRFKKAFAYRKNQP